MLFLSGSESNTSKVPKVIGLGKATEILAGASTAAAIASYASYLKFQEEEEITKGFKRTAFSEYIRAGSKVLEIGFGSGNGANIEYYPEGIELYAIDPRTVSEKTSLKAIKEEYLRRGVDLKSMTRASCEDLSMFGDSTFDVVVSTLVLCSVQDQEKSIDEILRVLKKGGKFIAEEHIYAKDTILGKSQKIFDTPQQILADGCHLTRQTDEAISRRVGEDREFASAAEHQIVTLNSHWPISRQLFGVYIK